MNIKRFWPVLRHFQSYDYSGLLLCIEVATKDMAAYHRTHGHTVSRMRIGQQLAVVSELCKRLNADGYFDNAGYDPRTWRDRPDYECHRIATHAGYMEKQDAAYLGRMFRYINHWWD
jgi:hypothetical protein